VNAGGNEGNTGNDKANGKEHEIRVNQQQEEDVREELIDISDMDYSPARRKTPIHNWPLGSITTKTDGSKCGEVTNSD